MFFIAYTFHSNNPFHFLCTASRSPPIIIPDYAYPNGFALWSYESLGLNLSAAWSAELDVPTAHRRPLATSVTGLIVSASKNVSAHICAVLGGSLSALQEKPDLALFSSQGL